MEGELILTKISRFMTFLRYVSDIITSQYQSEKIISVHPLKRARENQFSKRAKGENPDIISNITIT